MLLLALLCEKHFESLPQNIEWINQVMDILSDEYNKIFKIYSSGHGQLLSCSQMLMNFNELSKWSNWLLIGQNGQIAL